MPFFRHRHARVFVPEPHARDNLSGLRPCVTAPIRLCHCRTILHRRNNPRHGLYQAGIQQAAFLHPPWYGLCRKVRHDCKRSGGDKRERGSEDCATAQDLQILPHLHRRLHLSSPRALFLDKKQIQAIGCQSVKLIFYYQKHWHVSLYFCISKTWVSLHQEIEEVVKVVKLILNFHSAMVGTFIPVMCCTLISCHQVILRARLIVFKSQMYSLKSVGTVIYYRTYCFMLRKLIVVWKICKKA